MIKDPAAQGVCERCGAWLAVRPDFAEFVIYVRERPNPKCPHRSPTDSEVWSPFAVDNFYCDECVIEEQVEEWVYRFSCPYRPGVATRSRGAAGGAVGLDPSGRRRRPRQSAPGARAAAACAPRR